MSERRYQLSLNSKGAQQQLPVAIALVLVIPLLAFGFIAVSSIWAPQTYTIWMQAVIALVAMGISGTGYRMLRKYPRHIEDLRRYLQGIASGDLPTEIRLGGDMDDISAIARSLNTILVDMRLKMAELEKQLRVSQEMQKTIESQAGELLEAERHRVMVESLGAACHHIGQPATVLRLYLDSMSESDISDSSRQKLKECREAIESMAEVLNRLRNVSQYRTVPYQTFSLSGKIGPDGRILDIDQ
jgi:phosphoglycerate-specific signal transduction histidine kinase